MDTSPLTALAARLAVASLHLTALNVADLPPIGTARLDWDYDTATVIVRANLTLQGGPWATDQEAQIDAIRTWANALGGTVHLGRDRAWSGDELCRVRTLDARAEIPGGGRLEIYTLLNTTPAPELTAA